MSEPRLDQEMNQDKCKICTNDAIIDEDVCWPHWYAENQTWGDTINA